MSPQLRVGRGLAAGLSFRVVCASWPGVWGAAHVHSQESSSHAFPARTGGQPELGRCELPTPECDTALLPGSTCHSPEPEIKLAVETSGRKSWCELRGFQNRKHFNCIIIPGLIFTVFKTVFEQMTPPRSCQGAYVNKLRQNPYLVRLLAKGCV